MPKYRVQVDISFSDEQDVVDLMNYVEKVKSKTYKPTTNEKIPCHQFCRYHECSHADADPILCADYVDIEFDKPEKTHKVK